MSEAASSTQGRRALVTGLTGQDGSFLAELLLERGYEVTGVTRRGPGESLGCAEHLRDRVRLVPGDLLDGASLRAAVEQSRPQELYHLAAPSFVPASWEDPAGAFAAIPGATGTLLSAVSEVDPAIRVFAASSGLIFGDAPESPQRESTPCHPSTPYAVAKLAAHQLAGAVRAHRGLHVSSGIAFNHESERRPERFVTRKVTRAAAAIKLGRQRELALGDLDAQRDWSFAGDIMEAAWLMLQQPQPGDYVLASGVGRSVRELAEIAFARVGLDATDHVRVDPELVRAPERTPNIGDPSRARERIGWRPRVSFEELIERMVAADLRELGGAAGQRPVDCRR